ncbi:hypothetical protein GCM10027570_32530 [Streptomonospora sediminis]
MRALASGPVPAPADASGGAEAARACGTVESASAAAAAAALAALRSRPADLRRAVGEVGVTVVLCWVNGRGCQAAVPGADRYVSGAVKRGSSELTFRGPVTHRRPLQ